MKTSKTDGSSSALEVKVHSTESPPLGTVSFIHMEDMTPEDAKIIGDHYLSIDSAEVASQASKPGQAQFYPSRLGPVTEGANLQ